MPPVFRLGLTHARGRCLSLSGIPDGELGSRVRAAISGKLVFDKKFRMIKETDSTLLFFVFDDTSDAALVSGQPG